MQGLIQSRVGSFLGKGSQDTPNITVRAAQSLSGLSKIWSAVYTVRIALVVPYFKDTL